VDTAVHTTRSSGPTTVPADASANNTTLAGPSKRPPNDWSIAGRLRCAASSITDDITPDFRAARPALVCAASLGRVRIHRLEVYSISRIWWPTHLGSSPSPVTTSAVEYERDEHSATPRGALWCAAIATGHKCSTGTVVPVHLLSPLGTTVGLVTAGEEREWKSACNAVR